MKNSINRFSTTNCVECGRAFKKNTFNQMICSLKCKRHRYNNRQNKIRRDLKLSNTLICRQCGDEFKCNYTLREVYCSDKCKNIARSLYNKEYHKQYYPLNKDKYTGEKARARARKHYAKYKKQINIKQNKRIEQLHDTYVKRTLHVPFAYISNEVVEQKRLQLKLIRQQKRLQLTRQIYEKQ